MLETDAIVDTGATYVCPSSKNTETLGLPFHNTINIKTANGKASLKNFEGAKIELKGRSFVMEVMENDEDIPALIRLFITSRLCMIKS